MDILLFLSLSKYSHFYDFKIIECLVENKANIDIQNKLDSTPLHFICKNEKLTLHKIKFFVENNCNINLLNEDNDSVLHVVAFNPFLRFEMVKYLVENKSDFKCQK